jgi:pyruvate formate lyase activating enzyme
MPNALKASQIALERARDERRILRICWETNGYWKRELALKAAELSYFSGGNVKFDLKTWDENLNQATCGVSNAPTLESFKMIGEKYFKKRSEAPILTASTLLVPGYVDVEEVHGLASFIAEIDSRIPYTLLAFYPQYVMTDLPTTSRDLAYQCRDVAKKSLENVRIGNVRLLS